MSKEGIYIGKTPIKNREEEVTGLFVEIENEKFYKIAGYNKMADFFMSIVSNSDHWMFLSSNGALTAGRKNRENAIFPYYTDDKIHDYRDKVGSKTICLVSENDQTFLWEPFTYESEKLYDINRNLYKSIYGNKILFEEINNDLGLSFRYGWYNSDKYGWVKKASLYNISSSLAHVEIIDGLRNILPSGTEYAFQNEYSNLLDAYKKNELLEQNKLGLYMLSSIPVDKAEPSEALKATAVWSFIEGADANYLISDKQLEKFRNGSKIQTEFDIRASRGAYYINTTFTVEPGDEKKWYLVAEVNRDATDVANLDLFLESESRPDILIEEDIAEGTSRLVKIVSNADGMQQTNEDLTSARHFSNTLFNVMRGGIFVNNYMVETADFRLYVNQCNRDVYKEFKKTLDVLPGEINYAELQKWAVSTKSADLERICYEYLPLTFSRRHGDPSRPWNQFSIDTKNEDGTAKLNYQGNWRDIFQNWEALCLSYPEFIEGIISKFLNASTADGYNPYRIAREGIDWEAPDPDDPWAYIGYWGDHQIIYLQKFLEQSENFHPGKMNAMLAKEAFVYAHVPYKIKAFSEIIENPKDTIDFDFELNNKLKNLEKNIGADGKLLRNASGEIYRVNLLEKMLVALLAKLSNFIPEAGIWLNTQRPEWNDANNALVGNGASMVTLCYLRRFLKFWEQKFEQAEVSEVKISEEVYLHFQKMFSLLKEHKNLLEKGFSDRDRFNFLQRTGEIGSEYRTKIYTESFAGEKTPLQTIRIKEFVTLTLKYLDQSIRKNKRNDNLYHAYNLISIRNNAVSVSYLDEMLEGQVAVLSSGFQNAEESLEVIDALKASKLFRKDQYSYLLYPDKQLPRFTEKNNIPKEFVAESKLFQVLLGEHNQEVVRKDDRGNFHFNSEFRNADMLKKRLELLAEGNYDSLIKDELDAVLNMYEEVFNHRSFTGRSGTFYGYEGLGSIYWHMVSKLLLAAQESYKKGCKEGANPAVLGRLKDHYYEIKAGIGLNKSPELYGAFPTDAYSHTPGNAGVKQPGLTGQVKEDIISRFGELGVSIEKGEIVFLISLLNHNDILKRESEFMYYDLNQNMITMPLAPNQLAFTFCQVPFILVFGSEQKIVIDFANGMKKEIQGNRLGHEISSEIFERTGKIKSINYHTIK